MGAASPVQGGPHHCKVNGSDACALARAHRPIMSGYSEGLLRFLFAAPPCRVGGSRAAPEDVTPSPLLPTHRLVIRGEACSQAVPNGLNPVCIPAARARAQVAALVSRARVDGFGSIGGGESAADANRPRDERFSIPRTSFAPQSSATEMAGEGSWGRVFFRTTQCSHPSYQHSPPV